MDLHHQTHGQLAKVLNDAFNQSAIGKGQKRHGRGLRFEDQPIMQLGKLSGVGGLTYQVMKKASEATGMTDREEYDAAIAELHGVIVYAAAAVLHVEGLRERMKGVPKGEPEMRGFPKVNKPKDEII